MSQTDLSRIESFQYPAAHFGHLSDHQQNALDAFRKQCQDEGYYKPAGTNGKNDPSHDDETLLRYLRARRFNPQEAYKQFKETEDWRIETKVGDLYDSIDTEEYEQTRRLYPQWTGRRDKRGIPVFLYEVAPLNTKTIGAYEKLINASPLKPPPNVNPKLLRLVALYESLTRFVMPLCSAVTDRKHPETPISQSNNIVDISKVGLKQFWNLKAHMQDASTLATAHYPETLDRIFIIGAPAFFPTVWGWIKRWFDPITVSKIFILSPQNVFPTLSQYIDPENIPKKYGGNLDFEFGMMPILEPAIDKVLQWENPALQNGKHTLPIGPIKWEESHDGTVKAVAVGSEKGGLRRTTICRLETPVSIKAMHGLATVNTPIDELELSLTTDGTATQPPDTDDANIDIATPPTDSPTPAATPKPEAQETSTPSTTLPIREPQTQTPNETESPTSASGRTGTSDTRFAAQNQTHAAGQLAAGTPHSAINDHGHGDKTLTMEPSTVGQAPKEVNIVKDEGAPAPGYLDAAKAYAGQAAGMVTSTVGAVGGLVGGGGKTEMDGEEKLVEKEKSEEEKETERRIEEKANPVIEGFLREKTVSSAVG